MSGGGGGVELHRRAPPGDDRPRVRSRGRGARGRLHVPGHRPCRAVHRRDSRCSSTFDPTRGPSTRAGAEQLIGPRTVGIIVVDVFGQCADYASLRQLCDERGLWLVEDAAAGSGATYRGMPAGSFGDIGCFSLHARKGITSGEGGVFVSDDEQLVAKARKLSCFGVESAYARQSSNDLPVQVFDELGYNYKLSDILAAIAAGAARPRAGAPDRTPAGRRTLPRRPPRCGGPDAPPYGRRSRPRVADLRAHARAQLLSRRGRSRTACERRAGEHRDVRRTHVQPVYGATRACPTSADLFRRHLAIPMHAGLTDDDIDLVIDLVRKAVSRRWRDRVMFGRSGLPSSARTASTIRSRSSPPRPGCTGSDST